MSTASSRPARICITISTRRAASTIMSVRRTPTMRRWPRIGSIAWTTRTRAPKNCITQASAQAEFYRDEVGGHRYALQIVTDVPHFGGASGSSLEEAQSWGKLATDSAKVSVQADATIALPLLASALAESAAPLLAGRKKPVFTLAGRVMTVDGLTVPHERFEEMNESA